MPVLKIYEITSLSKNLSIRRYESIAEAQPDVRMMKAGGWRVSPRTFDLYLLSSRTPGITVIFEKGDITA